MSPFAGFLLGDRKQLITCKQNGGGQLSLARNPRYREFFVFGKKRRNKMHVYV